jgi:MFS family permease
MKRYGKLLSMPGVIPVVLAQLLARFPGGMLTIGLLIHYQKQTGNFTVPGLALAALSIGQAISIPVASRMISRYGIRPVLGTLITICTGATLVAALVVLDTIPTILLGFVIGASLAPIQPAARSVYPSLVPKRQLQSLQALDASIQELIWIAGPVITVFLATQIDSATAVLSTIVFGAGGGLWFLSRKEVGAAQLEKSSGRLGSVLKNRAVIIGVMSGFLVVGSFGAIEAATVAAFGSEKESIAGIVLGLWALSSLIAGLAMGHTPMGPWSLSRRLGVVALGTGLAMFTVDPILLTIALFISGLGVAPAMTVQYAIATESVSKGNIPESLGWLGTGGVGGAALASAIAGVSIDAWGATGGFVIATIFAGLAALVPTLFVKSLPDLRHLAAH